MSLPRPNEFLNPIVSVLRRRGVLDLLWQIVSFAGHRMKDAQLQEVASSMTLTTLLSLVPLIAVSLAVFAAFPSFADSRKALEDAIFQSFLPQQYSEMLVGYLQLFSNHASGLGSFGLAGLAVTALMLIDKFFVTTNRLFKVRVMRSWPQRAIMYWAILTLAPALIALSLSLSGQMIKLAAGVAGEFFFPGWVLGLFQICLQAVGYAVLYKFVPNCHVPFSHAAAGGLAVALVGQAVKQGFEIYVTAGTLSSIYGAFVAVPVFLLWMYVNWILVFSGAAITATIPLLTSGRYSDSYRLGNDFLTGVALIRVLAEEKLRGSLSLSVKTLSERVDSYPEAINRILGVLASAGYVGEIVSQSRREGGKWALLCDVNEKTLKDAFYALLVDPENTLVTSGRREEGMLCGWFRALSLEETLSRPIARVFALEKPAVPKA